MEEFWQVFRNYNKTLCDWFLTAPGFSSKFNWKCVHQISCLLSIHEILVVTWAYVYPPVRPHRRETNAKGYTF